MKFQLRFFGQDQTYFILYFLPESNLQYYFSIYIDKYLGHSDLHQVQLALLSAAIKNEKQFAVCENIFFITHSRRKI